MTDDEFLDVGGVDHSGLPDTLHLAHKKVRHTFPKDVANLIINITKPIDNDATKGLATVTKNGRRQLYNIIASRKGRVRRRA
jgi:hypothetical protein